MPRLPRKGSDDEPGDDMTTPGDEPIVETHPSAEDVQAAEPKTVADLEAEVAAKSGDADAETAVAEPTAAEEPAPAAQGQGAIETPLDKIAASRAVHDADD